MTKTKVAIIGSGNIGTDLMIKIMRLSEVLEMAAFVGIDPESDGLKRAERLGVPITAEGIESQEVLDRLREFDGASKGNGSRQDPYALFFDLLMHILYPLGSKGVRI